MKKKINLKLKIFEINKIILENKINKFRIEIYSIILYEIIKRLYVCIVI